MNNRNQTKQNINKTSTILKIMMKNKLLVLAALIGSLSLQSAKANTITVSFVSVTSDGSGNFDWTYAASFSASLLTDGTSGSPNPGPQSYFQIHDFDGFLGEVLAPLGSWVLSTPAVGPGTLGPAISGNSDSAAILNIVYSWVGSDTPVAAGSIPFVLKSSYGTIVSESFSSRDQVIASGGNNAAGGELNAPGALAVPDGGATVMLLGAAFSGIGLLRRKLVA